MTQPDLFTNKPPQPSRITLGNRLFDLLADMKINSLPISKVEQALKAHFSGLTFQSTGTKLCFDGRYRGLDLSITYTLYEEIRGSKKVPRVDLHVHLTGHHYPTGA